MASQLLLNQIISILDPIQSQYFDENEILKVTGITTDTRTLKPGEIFLALQGNNFDGHDFLEDAVKLGAIALIISQPISVELFKQIPQLFVEDTLVAYQKIALWWRQQFKIPIIGITGSVGKTTTKELIAAVLGTQGLVHKTEGNNNNEIGVPKTLLALNTSHDYAVIEMGMRARGEIALLTQITQPDIGIITNVGTAHIGRLGSEEAIAQAKCELLAQMPSSSIAILNHDNERLMKTAPQYWTGTTLTYGLEGGDLCGQIIDPQTLRVNGVDFTLPLAGRHNALNYLAALAVAKVLDLDWTPLTQGLSVQLPKGRSQRYQLDNDVLILDETYNAGLESMLAALNLLKETPGTRHIAVLGTMKELGEAGWRLHYQVGEMAQKLGIDRLLIYVDEPETEAIVEGANGVLAECFKTHEALILRLQEIVQSGDRILFKASNSVGLNQVVNQFRSIYDNSNP
ncbi:UDP-N-acetylmuramoyl-tripeptide--D-alanyl-D-alanine ligase [Aphanothece hegewaldii CCALA 016]|uniref:UDP-N-acetylmuramoyl-tripeptide--D-alanyl-D-alanine ligase n=1 Tax=Aphanothece hegewaldii CCALA 016 TaxID=2107694 RepID=A0A2T1M181_9CHRO|nr:UDP-N-acetylmuramoyl-tripeptide--D-alanyl-D-alanine ligase [Aphanothece hegewaldii]PSF38436.1 UDP-N-acetylmuramoyl-tripeptide--D-alanyl-D-alanine ligase [Aphanothece hegewaldii CCALA 016]